MKNRSLIHRYLIASLLLFAALMPCPAAPAEGDTFEFVDQRIQDILFVFSSYSGIPIVADETVSGSTSFRCAGTGFASAFEAFLTVNRLYANTAGSVWMVSKISVRDDGDQGIRVDALDATPAQILERVSRFTGRPVLFDQLPTTKLSVHLSAPTAKDAAALVLEPFAGYALEEKDGTLSVVRATQTQSAAGAPGTSANLAAESRLFITRSGSLYSADIYRAQSSKILDTLCREEGSGYSNLLGKDPMVSGIRVEGVPFDTLLSLVLAQVGAETVLAGTVRHFIPIDGGSATQRLRESGRVWQTYRVRTIRCPDALAMMAARFPATPTIPLADGSGFLAHVSPAEAPEIARFLAEMDTEDRPVLVSLKYISAAELFKTLPPSVERGDLTDTGTGTSVFFTGTSERRERFLRELREIDRPRARIRYDMLIVQYDASSSLSWDAGAEARQMVPGDTSSVSGQFGSLLDLNFDVITLFGYRFSAGLSAALAENRARVFADTTLHGISGESIKFQNTSTYRYRDSNLDPDTGKPIYTGVTREIVSGVVLDINGTVSGDGMVTMTIGAAVSKRGADVSETTGNPPATSEKTITTRLSAADGEPVILSGLTQNDESIVEQRMPLLSRIPLVGWLFRARKTTNEDSEMVIYLVPHVTNGPDPAEEIGELAATVYERFVLGERGLKDGGQ